MAKRNYLVEGLSGTGKSSVYEELIRRGYNAISSDRAWGYDADPDTGLPGGPESFDTWMWDRQKALFNCSESTTRGRALATAVRTISLRSLRVER